MSKRRVCVWLFVFSFGVFFEFKPSIHGRERARIATSAQRRLRRAAGELARRSVERERLGRARGGSRPARRALGGGRTPARWCLCGPPSLSGAVMSRWATRRTRSLRARRGRTTRAKSILWYVHPSRRRAFARERGRDPRPRSRPDRRFCCFFSQAQFAVQPENCRVTSIRSRAPLTLQTPQVVEDILNHSEEIAVAEDGRGGEVTLLRLLKVRPHRETTRDTLNRILIRALERGRMRFARKVPVRRRRPRIRRFFFLFSFFSSTTLRLDARRQTHFSPFPLSRVPLSLNKRNTNLPTFAGVRVRADRARHLPRGGHAVLPLPAEAISRSRSGLVGEVRAREGARRRRRRTRRALAAALGGQPRGPERVRDKERDAQRALAVRPVAARDPGGRD